MQALGSNGSASWPAGRVRGGLPRPIRFTRAICGDLAQAERREWWIANGLGGYAGGTIAGSLTRRYHGLLIAPVASPLGRRLILAKADATVTDGTRSWPLFTNRWKSGAVAPAGHVRIASFHLDYSVPVWSYEIEDHRIEARIWMEPGAHTSYAAWLLRPGSDPPENGLSLRVTLLADDRDHHGTTSVGDFAPDVRVDGERLVLSGSRPLHADDPGAGRNDGAQARLVPRFRSADGSRARAGIRPTTIFASVKPRYRSFRGNGGASLQASTPSHRRISRRRCAAVSTTTGRSYRPRSRAARPWRRRHLGLRDSRWRPMRSYFAGRGERS